MADDNAELDAALAEVARLKADNAKLKSSLEKHNITGAGGGVRHFGDSHAHTGEMNHAKVMQEGGGRMKFPRSDAPDASYEVPGAFDEAMRIQKPHAATTANRPRFVNKVIMYGEPGMSDNKI